MRNAVAIYSSLLAVSVATVGTVTLLNGLGHLAGCIVLVAGVLGWSTGVGSRAGGSTGGGSTVAGRGTAGEVQGRTGRWSSIGAGRSRGVAARGGGG